MYINVYIYTYIGAYARMYINICIYTHSSFLIHHSAFTIRHSVLVIHHSAFMYVCTHARTHRFLRVTLASKNDQKLFLRPKMEKKQLQIFSILPDFALILGHFGFILGPKSDRGAFLGVKV